MSTAFVLSGGGSLGAVQVGMLQALAAHGVQPDLLVGTSAGAVNALWVADHGMSEDSLAQLASLWTQLRRHDVFPVRPTQLLRGVTGLTTWISDSEPLGDMIRAHTTIDDLAETPIPVHVLATDLLTGDAVLISKGSPARAVRASAAIPGIFAPIEVEGRSLIDGALASASGVGEAAGLGATQIYVLPAGVACALPQAPRSALGVALHALTFLIEQRLITDVAHPPPGVAIRLVPPLCPMAVSAADFSHAAELIERARLESTKWIEEGGLELAQPARFLSLHDHHSQARS
ncbi:MAG: patatin-like phospholipase family protein [Marmoricola sp.]